MNEYKSLKEFYPTPPELIAKMVSDLDFDKIKYVLEPSAGKGDIVKFIKIVGEDFHNSAWYHYYCKLNDDITHEQAKKRCIEELCVKHFKDEKHSYYCEDRIISVDCIEIDPTLQATLKGKYYELIDDDFLKFDGEKHYDLIIMNPPFSEGDKHLLKAIQIAEKTGGLIRCLLNAETIKNPYSNSRKALKQKLDKYSAEFEYVKDAFSSGSEAERKTNVEVVIVKLTVPSPFKSKSRIIDELDEEEIVLDEPDYKDKELVTADYMEQAVLMYKREIAMGKKLIEEYLAIKPYITRHFETEETPEHVKGSNLYLVTNLNEEKLDFNQYVESVRFKYWYELLHNPAFLKGLTSNLRNEYFDNIKKLAKKEFSLSNIYKVKIEVLQRMAQGIEDMIVNLFEKLSYENSMDCEGNIHYYNGWKSNSAFAINPKVVVPYMDCWNNIFKRFRYDNYLCNFLTDVQKVLDYLDGGDTNCDMDVAYWLQYYEDHQSTKKLRFKYFTIDVFKKGTIHLRFTNLDLLKKLNIYGSMHKGWLPPSYGKKSYEEMEPEEQEVIDGFEGKEEYEKVFANTDKYIVAPEKEVLRLESGNTINEE